MPVSIFRCTSIGPCTAPIRDQAREPLDLREVVDDGDEPAREHLLVRAAVVSPHHQDGRADARLAKLDPLLEQRDAEAVDAGALERARDGRRAVPVGVGLEHRPDARSPACR